MEVIKNLHIEVKTDTVMDEYEFWRFEELPHSLYKRDNITRYKLVIIHENNEDEDSIMVDYFTIKSKVFSELCDINKKYDFISTGKLLIMNMGDYENSIMSFLFTNYTNSYENLPFSDDKFEEDENIMNIVATLITSYGDDYGNCIPNVTKISYIFDQDKFISESLNSTSNKLIFE